MAGIFFDKVEYLNMILDVAMEQKLFRSLWWYNIH